MSKKRKNNKPHTLDELGRIVIPKHIRLELGLVEGTKFKISVNNNGDVIFRRADRRCAICTEPIDIDKDVPLCVKCIMRIKNMNV